jgi:hypothetical protein
VCDQILHGAGVARRAVHAVAAATTKKTASARRDDREFVRVDRGWCQKLAWLGAWLGSGWRNLLQLRAAFAYEFVLLRVLLADVMQLDLEAAGDAPEMAPPRM